MYWGISQPFRLARKYFELPLSEWLPESDLVPKGIGFELWTHTPFFSIAAVLHRLPNIFNPSDFHFLWAWSQSAISTDCLFFSYYFSACIFTPSIRTAVRGIEFTRSHIYVNTQVGVALSNNTYSFFTSVQTDHQLSLFSRLPNRKFSFAFYFRNTARGLCTSTYIIFLRLRNNAPEKRKYFFLP